MRYYLISGERSGDLHASNLIKALKSLDASGSFRGMGGGYSQEVGMELALPYEEVAVMGFWEVVLGFRKILKYLNWIKNDILQFRPDVLILIDFGGFNMKIASWAKEQGIPVHYYIPPKVWAWNQKRVFKIKRFTDQVYCILPFEQDFFNQFGVKAVYVGNPLLDEIAGFEPHPFFHQKNDLNYQPIIALLPGSRKQEVTLMLQIMIKVVRMFPNAQFVVAGVSNLDKVFYQPAIESGIKVIFDQTYDLLHHATAAIVTSGTATLEAALFRVPQLVVYKTSPLSYAIGKKLIKVNFISLVNLIAGKEVVKELIQKDYNVAEVTHQLNLILSNVFHKANILNGYDEVKIKLGKESASMKVARYIFESLQRPTN
ncbi:lipid-A-disaccharide synthase [Cecembia calidifontis]|uniref:Lipid-A-disaccharide synthase n=1 Tax=Cecembia calidifontis TaxID=1187080 RepID=A0A4Q7P9G4_9BACT|nr:lipid-A-disaccharide synthase [Cecembia calidifontis]RZS96557.1 lipid-A-disaccharide synthase [Cecembia calidifontis]